MSRNTVIICNYALVTFWLFVGFVLADEMTLNVNVKKPIAVVSEKFLSITLDPSVLFNSDTLSDIEKSTSMAKALSPAYIRIGGPRSNLYVFEHGLYPRESQTDPGYTFSERDWMQIHQWAEKSGLDVIASIAPLQSDIINSARSSSWDPRNALDLISFSDHMGYNTSWQLGYECQTRCDANGNDLGRDVQRLRSMLDAFPRYAERALIAGPDVVTYKTRQQQQYLQDYFNIATSSLSAVTWHPDFAGISLEDEGVSMHHDNLALDKDSFYKVVGRQIAKKPLWIAESRPEECKRQFLGALVWARRLGNSAKLGVQVLMRQPDNSNLFKPTPDYWVSMLHKMLVGREVLDTRIATGNRTHVHFYCHYTKPSHKYEKGSLTVFGINLTPTKVTAALKGLKLKVVHKYILLPGYDSPNRMFAETILLNNELLSLVDGKQVPEIQPSISSTDKGVKLKLPSGGIGFWVLPDLKIKSCMGQEDEASDRNLLKRINKRLKDADLEVDSEPNSQESLNTNASSEESKALLRQQLNQSPQRKSLIRRNNRPKEEEKDIANESRSRRHNIAHHGFEKLEKLTNKKVHRSVKHKSGNSHTIFNNEENNGSSEESLIDKSNSQQIDSGEVIRAKLERYKKRWSDYENKKKQRDLSGKKYENIDQKDGMNKSMDTGKVIETLTLLTNVESAVKGLEKDDGGEIRNAGITQTLGKGDFTDINVGIPRNPRDLQNTDNDGLLDEVLNSEKSKRTSVPTKIEDQLKALYKLLSEEKEKKEVKTSSRKKRSTVEEKPSTEEPINNRRNVRSRAKTDEGKERRSDRASERKQRLHVKLQQRRGQKEEIKKENASGEKDFYGFDKGNPLQNFPQGDVYLQTSAEKKDNGYKLKPQGSNTSVGNGEHENVWLEESDSSRMPHEFYESTKRQRSYTKEIPNAQGELSPYKTYANENLTKGIPTYSKPETGTEGQQTVSKDHNGNEKAMQRLMNYYSTDSNQKEYYPPPVAPYQQEIPHYQQGMPHYQQIIPHYQHDMEHYLHPPVPYFPQLPIYPQDYPFYQQEPIVNPGNYFVDPNQRRQPKQAEYHRLKREVNDLENEMEQEMINQDDDNLKDCQCRVIRGEEDCKDCIEQQKQLLNDKSNITPVLMMANNINKYSDRSRFPRDIKETDNITNENEETTETIISTTAQQDEMKTQQEEMQSKTNKQSEESEETSNIEANTKEYEKEEIVSTTTHRDNQLNIQNDDDDAVTPNRLPRTAPKDKFFQKSRGNTKSKRKENFSSTKQQTDSSKQKTSITKQQNPNTKENTDNIKQSTTNNKEDAIDTEQNITNIKDDAANVKQETINNVDTSTLASQSSNIKQSETIVQRNKSDRSSSDATTQTTNTTPSESSTISKDTTKRQFNNPVSVIETAGNSNSEIATEENSSFVSSTNTKLKSDSDDKRTVESDSNNETTISSVLNNPTTSPNTAVTKSSDLNLKSIKKPNSLTTQSNNKLKSNPKIDDVLKTRQARLTTRAEALAALRKENESRRTKKMIETTMKILDSESARFAEYKKRRQEQLERLKMKLRAKREKMLQQYRDELLEAINVSSDVKQRKLQRRDLTNYDPIKYDTHEDAFVRLHSDPKKRNTASRNQAISSTENDEDKYQGSKNRKRHTPFHEQFSHDEIYDISGEQELQILNRKRSPYSLIKRDPKNIEVDNYEYYLPLYGAEAYEYYPISARNDKRLIPLQIKYNQNSENAEEQHDLNNYFDENEEIDELEKNKTEEHDPIKPKHRKPKRSSLRIVEIDPWLYESEYEPKYHLQELMRPSSKLYSRSYRHNPFDYTHKRYRRETILKKEDELNGPTSFSLGLDKSKMTSKNTESAETSDILVRKKRTSDNYLHTEVATPSLSKSLINKNVKKVYNMDYKKKNKKLSKDVPFKTLKKNKLQSYIYYIKKINTYKKLNNIPSKVKFIKSVNYIDNGKNNERSLKRQKRSDDHHEIFNNYKEIKDNGIDRSMDPEMDEIWTNIIEMKQDEELLNEYKRKKDKIIHNFKETQRALRKYMQSTTEPSNNEKNSTQASTSTTQTNLESMLVEAIPKLQIVITGGLEKAQNLTGSLEDFIENFDDQFANSTEMSTSAESKNNMEENNGRLSHQVFHAMVGSVKKFFGLISGIAKIFHGH